MVSTLFFIFFFSSIIFFAIAGLTWAIFGRLIVLQIKRWFLASKGYVEFEHISETMVRNYFILKPKDKKFDLMGGFYHYIPEVVTRKGAILPKYDASFWNNSEPDISAFELEGLDDKAKELYIRKRKAEWEELKNVYAVISKFNYNPSATSKRMGMPVVTYYGDNPDPINPADRDKKYGSGVIKDMYLRLLLTQRYKDFRTMVLVMAVSLGIIAIAVYGLYRMHKGDVANYAQCVQMANNSINNYASMLNSTLQANAQSSVVTI